jgi:acyl-CoA thioesterase II
MGALGVETAVAGESQDGIGRYTGEVWRDWEIWGPNGGYLAAIALRAAGVHTGRARPASLSVQFLRPGRFEPIELEVRTVRGTRRADCVHVVARQGGDDILTAQAWAVDEVEGLEHHHAPIPVATPPEATPTVEERLAAAGRAGEAPRFRFWDNFESRPLHWVDDWEHREPTEPEAGGWYRFAHDDPSDDPWVDAARCVVLVDTFTWPAATRAHRGEIPYIAPSLDLNVQLLHHVPDSPWLLAIGQAPVAHQGTIGCYGRVWSADGRLAAMGTGTCLCTPVRG